MVRSILVRSMLRAGDVERNDRCHSNTPERVGVGVLLKTRKEGSQNKGKMTRRTQKKKAREVIM
jgi:hypothetical protein